MGKFQQKLYKFMYGRYGVDKLYSFCCILVIIVLFVNILATTFIKNEEARAWLSMGIMLFDVVILAWSTFRLFSKNIYKRRRENEIFLKMSGAVKRFVSLNTSRRSPRKNADTRDFVFRACTKCGAVLRLPRREGKHKVKCPRCSHRFNVSVKKLK